MARVNFRRWLSRMFPAAVPASRSTAFRPRVDGLEDRLAPATFSVTTAANAGAGSLRQAILDANSSAGADVINFAITAGGSIKTIQPTSVLPAITETVTIDGTTQTGYADLPLIVLNGTNAGNGSNGLVVSGTAADGTIIRGLAIQRFKANGILLLSSNNTVEKCFIGTNAVGSAAPGNGANGIAILGASSGNTIGGTTALAGNLISGNGQRGILMRGSGVAGNFIAGNAIGLDLSLAISLPNKQDGVAILQGANNNIVGDPNGINLIEGNGRFGVSISGPGTTGNNINNNTIAFNTSSGIQISAGTSNNIVTGFNTLSSNKGHGIHITGAGTAGNVVSQNRIGTNFAGDTAFGNKLNGVQINGGATGNIIGGTSVGDSNIISGNTQFGVNITGSGTSGNTVSANMIGTNLAGTAAVANKTSGVQIGAGASGNTIGGATVGERNVISGNAAHGVLITGAGAAGNTVDGNFIGVNLAGTAALANKAHGVVVSGTASNNTIGGTLGNVISGNTKNGINLTGSGTTGNTVSSNTIGLDALGAAVVGNGFNGVQVTAAANGNTINANVISGNARSGVIVNGSNQTIITSNNIGTDMAGTGLFANSAHGVFVTNKAANNFIGGTSGTEGNIIANNAGVGVLIGSDPSAGFSTVAGVGNAILGNSIFNNVLLGIDIGPRNGVSANDVKDPDTGPNNRQNFPVLASATIAGTDVQIAFALNSLANTTFRIEFFASPTGQGKNFLGFIDVTTDASGNTVATTATVPYTIALGTIITATATNLTTNDTSEFALGVTAV